MWGVLGTGGNQRRNVNIFGAYNFSGRRRKRENWRFPVTGGFCWMGPVAVNKRQSARPPSYRYNSQQPIITSRQFLPASNSTTAGAALAIQSIIAAAAAAATLSEWQWECR